MSLGSSKNYAFLSNLQETPLSQSQQSSGQPLASGSKSLMHGRLSLAPHMLQQSGIKSFLNSDGSSFGLNQVGHPSLVPPSTPVNQNIHLNGPPGSLMSVGRMSLGPARTARNSTPVQSSTSQTSNLTFEASTPFAIANTKIPQVQFQIPESKRTPVQEDAVRPSMAPNRVPLIPRTSIAAVSSGSNPFQVNPTEHIIPASQSANPVRTSLTARRSSASARPGSLASGSLSLSNTNGSVAIKDPDKTFQFSCIRSLIKFLAESSYDKPISAKILSSPSGKDFQSIFKFLYSCLDPGFDWGLGKFEDEVPGILKNLRYPFANEISKSYLQAVGSMHAWPSLLAMLQWMVDLILCCDQIQATADEPMSTSKTALDANSFMAASMSKDFLADSEKMFFEYVKKSYKMFLSGDDNYEVLRGKLSSNFERQNTTAVDTLSVLQKELDHIESQIKDLETTESPLIQLEKDRLQLEGDIEKYAKFIKHQEGKCSKLEATLATYHDDFALIQQELDQHNAEKRRLEGAVAAQPLSPEDVDRMRAEKDSLTKNLDYVYKLREEWQKNIADHEAEYLEKDDLLKKLMKEYNDLAEKLSLVPLSAKHAHGKNLTLCIKSIALEQYQTPSAILSLDMKTQVMPIIDALRESYQFACRELQDNILVCQETIDKLVESTNDKLEEILLIEEKIKKMSIQYGALKEQATQENKMASQEMAHLERDLDLMKNELATGHLLSQQQLQKMTMELDTLKRRHMDEKERLGKLVFTVLEESIALKNHIQTRLEEFQGFANSLEKSL
jgi:kinetochore protein NDC80